MAPSALFLGDTAALFEKWLIDLADAQLPSGAYPDVAPRIGVTGAGNAGWADAGVLVPWALYQQTGNIGVIERQYDSMHRYLRFLEADHVGGIRHGGRYGDWLALEGPDQPGAGRHGVPGARLGDVRPDGPPARSRRRRDAIGRLAATARSAFRRRFTTPPACSSTRPRRAMPSRSGSICCRRSARQVAADRLAALIEAADGHLLTGFLGTPARPARAVRPRTPRAGDPSGPPGHVPRLGLRGPPGRDDDLGALEFVDAGARVRGPGDELVQPRGAGLASPSGCTRTSRASPLERPATGRCSFALGRLAGSSRAQRDRTSRPTATTRSSGRPMPGGSRSRSTCRRNTFAEVVVPGRRGGRCRGSTGARVQQLDRPVAA